MRTAIRLTAVCALLAASSCTACVRKIEPEIVEGKMKMPVKERSKPVHSLDELGTIVESLNPKIGGYPPRLQNVVDRRAAYRVWEDAFLDAKAYTVTVGDTEQVLWVLAELARQGHNMDVENMGVLAGEVIEKCLAEFPESVRCHFSSADFYLSVAVSGESLANAQRSLSFLRKHFAPKVNENVEESYIYYYTYERKPELALKQIDRYLSLFPKSPKRAKLLEMKVALKQEKKTEGNSN